jgi:alpha-1,2-mannosyltransferase
MNLYGLRLLRQRSVQQVLLATLALGALAFRIGQLIAGRADLPWGFDFSAYWAAGRRLLDDEPLYSAAQLAGPYAPQAKFLYLYPPPFAAAMTPFAALWPNDYLTPFAVWVGVGLAVVIASVLWLARTEIVARGASGFSGLTWLLVVFTLALPAVSGELVNGNVHFLLVGLLTFAWAGVRRGDAVGDRVAGLAIGVAALIKVFPGLVVIWFVLTGRTRSAVWAILGAVVVSALALPLTGVQPWLDYGRVLLNMAGPIDPTFSLAPTTWLTPVLGMTLARILVSLGGLVVVVWVARQRGPMIGFAATIVAALLITPILWAHYLTVLVVPLVLAVASGVSLVVVGVVYLLLSTGNQAAFGDIGFLLARVCPTAGMLLLLGALVAKATDRRGTAAA